jgi:hypothetical protein
MQTFEVVSPVGQEIVQSSGGAKRLDSLDGKTIGEVWNGVFKGDTTFPIIREQLKQAYPNLRIIPYTEFPHTAGSDNPTHQRDRARELAAMARERGCDAVISGMGA